MDCLRGNFSNGVILDGRFRTVSPLNHGSFGMVFMATDLHTNRPVAIKCLTKKTAADDACLDLAIDDKSEELTLHRRLGLHNNIVNLSHSFETDAHIYLVLEYCSRGDLYEAIRHGHGPLETEHVRQFMLELVDAVSYIHSKGIYHRDIKPENIFLTETGAMKLGDFGLATTEKWTLEMTVGSDRYMSPEQYDSAGAGYSPAQADIWAIGICLLNILFSRNPFTTPTEADPLFLDFSRDKQSLFDVFPSMSQDTYEVIVQCMNMDPQKRSLVGARAALQRVVSFTTLEESLDDFCPADQRRTVATANREPLRTPSIQSPQVDGGAFPWARALHTSPRQHLRTLNTIPDIGSYSEDLFASSADTADSGEWYSGSAQTPSMSSVLDSNFGASMKSLHISGTVPIKSAPRAIPKASTPLAGSLPINMAKPRGLLSSMSMVFGRRKDAVSKSWSDMWDEDVQEEAEEEEQSRHLQARQEMNSRTWSHESATGESTGQTTIIINTDEGSEAAAQAEALHSRQTLTNDVDIDLAADGFFFHDPLPTKKDEPLPPARYSPPKRGDAMDKWAALGERRRAYTGHSDSEKSPDLARPRRGMGFGFGSSGAGLGGVWDHYTNNNQRWNREREPRAKECPWNKGRDWNWRREKRTDFGDIEWVGGWQAAHS